jgi:uncharacterized protein (TIGR02453 family)
MMDLQLIFDFLRQLSAHNDREWFHEHKPLYQAASLEFDKLLTILISRVGEFDPSVRHLQPKDCTWRIYRDVRFSLDKRPYKTHIGGFLSAKGKKSLHCGYYFHLEPEGSFYAGGTYGLTPKQLQEIRYSIYDSIDEYRSIIENKKFKKYFPTIGEDRLKVNPKGFPKDFTYMELLKPKDFSVWHHLDDKFFNTSDFVDVLVDMARTSKPFLDFLNYTVDDFVRNN